MQVEQELVINAEPWEVRVANLENGRIADLYVERSAEQKYVGNIYKGKVVRVLPGMQAAFVEIGLDRTAFLYVSEITDEFNQRLDTSEDPLDDQEDEEAALKAAKFKGAKIQDLIKEGQEVLVQVTKAPMGTKGARLTCYVSLPGRSLVLMPNVDQIGISRRIGSEAERRRLRDIIARIKRKGEGIIMRTASEGQTESDMIEDVEYLHNLWADIQKRAESTRAPALIYSEINLALRCVRDLISDNIKRITVDNPDTHKQILDFMNVFIPKRVGLLEAYRGEKPLFEALNLENAISKSLEKKVWLKSGGYLIIEQTEALCAIDVNTGRYVGDKNFDETILKTNLEAVEEIVYQLRFRNLGGIIILDLIDMDRAAHREKVFRALEDALKADKARTKVSKITSLGLVEMTRKRTQENIGMALTEPCSLCHGAGRLKSRVSVCYEIYRAVQREAKAISGSQLHINLHPEVMKLLQGDEKTNLATVEKRVGKKIALHKDSKLSVGVFEIHA